MEDLFEDTASPVNCVHQKLHLDNTLRRKRSVQQPFPSRAEKDETESFPSRGGRRFRNSSSSSGNGKNRRDPIRQIEEARAAAEEDVYRKLDSHDRRGSAHPYEGEFFLLHLKRDPIDQLCSFSF